MGALTSNRKHGDDCFLLNKQNSYRNFPSFQVSKKPRFSVVHQAPESGSLFSSNSAASRIYRYPEAKPPFPGQPHAPCRNIKLGHPKSHHNRDSSTSIRGDTEKEDLTALSSSSMWNFLKQKYDLAKNNAFAVLQYLSKSKEEIAVDTESEEEVKSDDSNVEEVVVIEDDEADEKIVEDRTLQACSSIVTEVNNESLAVENAEKLFHSLSLDHDSLDVSGVEAYKKLLETAERRSLKLESLGFEIELNEKRRASIHASQTVRIHKEKPVEVPPEPFTPLSKDDEAEVKQAFASGQRVLVSHDKSNIQITGQILQFLRPGQWLNDEVINLYLELLKERESREPKKFLKCHFFNTFFYKKLVGRENGYNYGAVRRWTSEKKLGYCLSSCDKIFVPIHEGYHWCLAVISKKDQKFQYLDSMKGKDHKVLSAVARYYVEEVKDKSGKDIDVSNWELEIVEDFPGQENWFDCGMFMVKYIDFYSRGLGLCFDQVCPDHEARVRFWQVIVLGLSGAMFSATSFISRLQLSPHKSD